MWLMSPNVYQLSTQTPISVLSGGTGTADIPTNGQLLIGNGTNYNVNNLGTGDGISVTMVREQSQVPTQAFCRSLQVQQD
jgi:hypothetical protein